MPISIFCNLLVLLAYGSLEPPSYVKKNSLRNFFLGKTNFLIFYTKKQNFYIKKTNFIPKKQNFYIKKQMFCIKIQFFLHHKQNFYINKQIPNIFWQYIKTLKKILPQWKITYFSYGKTNFSSLTSWMYYYTQCRL